VAAKAVPVTSSLSCRPCHRGWSTHRDAAGIALVTLATGTRTPRARTPRARACGPPCEIAEGVLVQREVEGNCSYPQTRHAGDVELDDHGVVMEKVLQITEQALQHEQLEEPVEALEYHGWEAWPAEGVQRGQT